MIFDKIFKKKRPKWPYLIKQEDVLNDLKILHVPLNENIVKHLAHDLLGLEFYRMTKKSKLPVRMESGKIVFGDDSKFDYEKSFLDNYEKTKAITLFRKYSNTPVLPKGKSLIRDIFRDLLKIEGPIIASWIAASGEKSKKVVEGIEKMLKATKDKELNNLYKQIKDLAKRYKGIMKMAKKKKLKKSK